MHGMQASKSKSENHSEVSGHLVLGIYHPRDSGNITTKMKLHTICFGVQDFWLPEFCFEPKKKNSTKKKTNQQLDLPVRRYFPGLAFVAFPIAICQMPGSFFFVGVAQEPNRKTTVPFVSDVPEWLTHGK